MLREPRLDELLSQTRAAQKAYQQALSDLERARRRALHIKSEVGKITTRTEKVETLLECKRISSMLDLIMGV